MSKKSDAVYYDNFIHCIDCACRASRLLADYLADFDPAQVEEQMDAIHSIENEADQYRHDISALLVDAFITPLERDDIMSISHMLDDIVDSLDDVLMRIYMCNITEIRPEAIQFVSLAIQSCDLLKKVMEEFQNFKKSKTIHQNLIAVNSLENEGDKLYLESMRRLHTSDLPTIDIISWRDIYHYLERCLDSCESAAHMIEVAMMKNS